MNKKAAGNRAIPTTFQGVSVIGSGYAPAAFIIAGAPHQAGYLRNSLFLQGLILCYPLLFIAACSLAGLVSGMRALYHDCFRY